MSAALSTEGWPDRVQRGMRGWYYAGKAAQRADDAAANRERDAELRRVLENPGVLGWHDARLAALDAAEQAGEATYAAERARQGLVTYERHRCSDQRDTASPSLQPRVILVEDRVAA